MPFVSKSQRRACYAKKAAGETGWDCGEWEAKTHGDLPERKKKLPEFSQYLKYRNPKLYQELASHEGLPKDIEKAQKKPGGSNVGEKRKTSSAKKGPFCGPMGGAPKGSFPVTSSGQARSAKAYAHNAPNPEGVKKCVDRVMKKKKD